MSAAYIQVHFRLDHRSKHLADKRADSQSCDWGGGGGGRGKVKITEHALTIYIIHAERAFPFLSNGQVHFQFTVDRFFLSFLYHFEAILL